MNHLMALERKTRVSAWLLAVSALVGCSSSEVVDGQQLSGNPNLDADSGNGKADGALRLDGTPGTDATQGAGGSAGASGNVSPDAEGLGGSIETGGTTGLGEAGGSGSGGGAGIGGSAGGAETGGGAALGGASGIGGSAAGAETGGGAARGGALGIGGSAGGAGAGGDGSTGGLLGTTGGSAGAGAAAGGSNSVDGGAGAAGGPAGESGSNTGDASAARGGADGTGGSDANDGSAGASGSAGMMAGTGGGGGSSDGGSAGGSVETGGNAGSAGIAGSGGSAGDVATLDGGTDGSAWADGSADGDSGSGYQVQCEYLRAPDRSKDMLKSLADFRVKARDDANGGFFTYVNEDGTVSSDHRKSFVTQTRDAWAFSRAFMVTGDETYLDHASHALEHLYSHGWDSTNGGWYFISDEQGALTPLQPGWNPNTYKWSFIQHYALLGIGALCDATHEAATCSQLREGRRFLDEEMWDPTPTQLGYYEYGSLDLSTVRSKGFTATVDAMTTHAIQIDLLWPTDSMYRRRLLDLADITADRLAANMDLSRAQFGFPEYYDTDWTVDSSQTSGYVGHVLKSAWVLARVYLRHPDAHYREAARKLIYEVLNNGGWDETNGVPYTNTNWSSGWKDTSTAECWEIEQAVTSGLSNWYIGDNPADRDTFLRMADRALSFFADHVVDDTNGGTYKMNYVTGSPKGTAKSNEFNVEYHSTETFYFAYLYGNLMLHRAPVTLYYRVPASTTQQVIQLNPVAIDDSSLQIKSVTLGGVPLTTFSGPSREVTLEPNQGGKLAVVFGPAD